jgi:integrase
MPKITKRLVDATGPAGRDVFVWDAELPGFGLRVKPSGTKSYLLQYRNAEGRSRRLTLGRHGPVTAERAREKARRLLADVADGVDPAEVGAAARQAPTVAQLAALYLAEGPVDKPTKKASSWAADASNLRRHVLPLLGPRLAMALTAADVAKFQASVAAGKSAADERTRARGRAIVTGGKGTAARSLGTLAAMLEWAVRRGLLAANPAKGVRPYKGAKKERFLTLAELGRLGDALRAAEAGGVNPGAVAAVRLLLTTGCRKSEILGLRWSHVDGDRGCLRLPDSKTGAKVVPLGSAALEVLANLKSRTDRSPFVLPSSRGGGHIVGLQKLWARIRAAAGLDGVRLHDCRHSFASVAVADGAALFTVGKVLGHRQARTTEIYAHLGDDPVRRVADATSRKIAAALRAGEANASAPPLAGTDGGPVERRRRGTG